MNAKTPSTRKPAPTPTVARKAAPVAVVPLVNKQRTTAKPVKVIKSSVKDLPKKPSQAMVSTAPVKPSQGTKQAHLITLLQAKSGATIDQIRDVTGWQAHTVRGTISGVLRKKLGLNVTCEQVSATGSRLYRIVGPAVVA